MKKLILLLVVFRCVMFAALPPSEEIQFRFEPSFTDGTLVSLARAYDGKIRCAVYRLPVVASDGLESHSKIRPVLVKEVDVSAADFQALVSLIERPDLRAEAESLEPVGIDGTSWVFRRKAGGRIAELSFWTPELRKSTEAYALGTKFMAIAQLKGVLPEESEDPRGGIPTIVADTSFVRPASAGDASETKKKKEPHQTSEPTAPSGRGSP